MGTFAFPHVRYHNPMPSSIGRPERKRMTPNRPAFTGRHQPHALSKKTRRPDKIRNPAILMRSG
jgi:hypothetical protein